MSTPSFEYDGYLVFTPALVKYSGGSSGDRETIIDSLPEFEQGTPENPQNGFQLGDFPYYALNDSHINSGIKHKFRDLLYIRYISESYNEVEAYSNGNMRSVYARNVDKSGIFWFDPKLALLRGKKQSSEQR